MLIVPVAWLAVDARPALGMATYLALWVVTIISYSARSLVVAQAEAMRLWPVYAILLAVGGLALVRLRRRQAAS